MGARTFQIAALLALGACSGQLRGAAEPEAERRQRWQDERQALDASLDRLEERLIVDQARVRFWREMKARHESVTAVACTSLGHHADEIARFEEQQEQKSEALARGRRVALGTPAEASHRR